MHRKFFMCTIVMGLVAIAASARGEPIIRDMCNQTSGDGQGHTCPGPNDLLVRPKYADGTCGDWMCCPQNPDGKTYDCSHPTNPARGAIGTLDGSRVKAIDPAVDLGPRRPPAFPGPKPSTLGRAGGEAQRTRETPEQSGKKP